MDSFESRMTPRFLAELEKGMLWEPRVIESGRFQGRRKGNEKSFVLLSLSWFSVIYVVVACACKYVNQWDKTTIWSMMQICAIKGINLLHGVWHKRAVKKMKLWYGVWHKHNVQSWGYNYGVWHKRMCCSVKVIQPWSMTQAYLHSWGYNYGAFMMQIRAVKGIQLMNYGALVYDKNTCAVEGNVLLNYGTLEYDANTCAVKGIQLMNYGVLEYDKNTCAVEGNITTKLWNTGVWHKRMCSQGDTTMEHDTNTPAVKGIQLQGVTQSAIKGIQYGAWHKHMGIQLLNHGVWHKHMCS